MNQIGEQTLNRVANLTLLFWVIKILSTTAGETVADYINADLGLGLNLTTVLMGIITVIITIWNFQQKRYNVSSYWSLIIMMSIEGTLITDYLVDTLGISLITLDIVFTIVMILLFLVWYKKENTLSIHEINNNSRELFYWLIVLTAFAVGTAYGDSVSEYINLGYTNSFIAFSSIFALAAMLYYSKMISGVTAFWLAFIVTRPIGASLGDLLIQPTQNGGLNIDMLSVNLIFTAIIIASIVYLKYTQKLNLTK